MFRRFKSFSTEVAKESTKRPAKPITLMDIDKKVTNFISVGNIFIGIVAVSSVCVYKSYIDATALIHNDLLRLDDRINKRSAETDNFRSSTNDQIQDINKKLDKHDSIILAIKRGIVE